ncbi:MAG TPA: DEAD/DEAH box helicase family protein [Ignavibacteria bacterium]
MVFNVSEQTTRFSLIDPQLKKADWNLSDRSQVRFEIPVENYDTELINGFTDYCLYRENGEVLAVVEAKRTNRDAREGLKQVEQYIKEIEKKQSFRPFAFLANGFDVFYWDSESSAERHVAGFFSRENLERLLFIKQNRLPLNTIKIKDTIVNRAYQVEAIRRISETIEQKKRRKALLVMATGTGKTRTIMALIDIFLRARQAQKILFLADRDTLVEQALTDGFKKHIPDESRSRIRTYEINKGSRVFVSTIQTLEICYNQFTPADFDLIISDECHRSIYNKFTDVLAYFDAVQIGLTATPARFIERDTFKFFGCDGVTPTFLYDYDTAVNENYLAEYNVYGAQTKFQRKGIKFDELTEEDKQTLIDRGLDPEDINFEGTDLEKKVTNQNTLCRQWEEFMDVCYKDSTGQLPAKSIFFAITHKHAMRLKETFDSMYLEYGGKLVQVIDSKMERNKDLLADFKKEDLPRIAISVDMLDTGFDFPEVVNLAFMKPVNSQIKFWQMIGRGTRHFSTCERIEWLPERKKDYFLIVDYWENFEHFEMMPPDDEGKRQIPVYITIFHTRLNKLAHVITNQESDDAKSIICELRNQISKIPLESFTVRQVYREISDAWENDYWNYITPEKISFLRMKVAPLLRFVAGLNPPELFFTSKMERSGLLHIEKKELVSIIESIKEDVMLLPTSLPQVAMHRTLINDILTGDFWKNISLQKLDDARRVLAPLMKYKREKPSIIIELGLDDIIDSRKWVILRKESKKVYVEEYRRKIEERILKLASELSAVAKLQKGETPSQKELEELEIKLHTELQNDEFSLDDDNMLKAFGVKVGSLVDFLKHILKLESLPSYMDIIGKAFDAFVLEHNYNADQSRFLRAVQTVFLERRKLDIADLYEHPFTNFGTNAVEKLFTEEEIEELIKLTKKLAA